MASIYQVGQYRFSGNCIENLNNTYMLKTWPTSFSLNSEEDDDSSSSKMIFTDFAISPKGDTVTTFDADTDYYISIPIPIDFNTSYDFTIKLLKAAGNEQDDTRGSYQFICNFSVAQTGNANNLYEIVLYNKNLNASAANYSDEEVVTQILTSDDIYNVRQHLPKNPQDGHLYYAGEKDWRDYYIYKKSTNEFIPASKMVKASLYASWRTNQSADLYSYIDLVFRPVEPGFRDLVFEMDRGAQDYGLINGTTVNADGSTSVVNYGRKVDISRIQDKWKICRVNNLVPKITDGSPLERIGVWGHPGQIMAINGEQIKIGPSGYYELEGLDVSSFGIVAENDQYKRDGFTLDYGYYSNIED